MKSLTTCALALLLLLAAAASADQPAPPPKDEDPRHEELRGLLRELTEAYNKGDYEKVFTYLDDDVVVTWQNGQVNRKPAEVRAFFKEMLEGPNHYVESTQIHPTVDELAHLYGDTAVAFGSSDDHLKLTNGMDLNLHNRWTATVVKKNNQWKVASFQVSVNMFNNPVMDIAIQRIEIWTAVIAGTIGLLLGALIMFVLRRRVPKPAK
jgi:ketosteroid isomerase-like protein